MFVILLLTPSQCTKANAEFEMDSALPANLFYLLKKCEIVQLVKLFSCRAQTNACAHTHTLSIIYQTCKPPKARMLCLSFPSPKLKHQDELCAFSMF